MKIVALHTDFRIYWKARLSALARKLHDRGDSLYVIEIAGKGGNYSFLNTADNSDLSWKVLFPESRPEELEGSFIEKRLFPILDDIKPDVIISGAIAFPSGALAVKYGKKHDVRVVSFDDTKIEGVKRSGLVNFIKQSIYNGVDAMLYPAAPWSETGHFWRFDDREIFFGVDVVDNDFWSVPSVSNLAQGEFFVAVGRQIEQKNFFSIVRAYKDYVDTIGRENAYKMLFVGDGPEHSKIMSFAKENGIDDLVIMSPFLSQVDLRGIYQQAKALILSSVSETWGLVINEAMACGCPILASKQCGATSVLVKENENGFSFDCCDYEELARKMAELHNLGTEKQASMSRKSKEIIADWGLERFSGGVCDAIDYVMSHPKRKTGFIDNILINIWKGRYRPI